MSSNSAPTRTRILEATVRMLEAHGGRGVRMGDIARAAGVSRQAVYLHFATRTELLVAATRHLDAQLDLDGRLARSRAAGSGVERLHRYIEFWGDYVPRIHAVARALLAARDTDEAAAAAWGDRMAALRDGCRAAVEALRDDGALAAGWSADSATDVLWTLLLVPSWEHLTRDCGWTGAEYVARMKTLASRALVAG
ncbi:MAG: TetR/AcrR family transcriptional regulator [Ectothiorhodospiraceae bacterium]|nr:TetR/AcrR family transcriptional regulator [Chromatiales bacterium]MCP5154389.1 TetR/AcrR family transcriptional regulator [Ectothiorhodospiraceae bacterium]